MSDILVRIVSSDNVQFCQASEGEYTWLSTKGKIGGGVISADNTRVVLDKEAFAKYNAALAAGSETAHHTVLGCGTFDGRQVVAFASKRHGTRLLQLKDDVRAPAQDAADFF